MFLCYCMVIVFDVNLNVKFIFLFIEKDLFFCFFYEKVGNLNEIYW